MEMKMTPEEHLAQLLDEKNDRIRKLEKQVKALEEQLNGTRTGWMHHKKLPEEQALPVPRLEIVIWEDPEGHPTHGWDYQLVYRHWCDDVIAVPLGKTTTHGPREWPPRDSVGKLTPPRRDGFHIRCDATRFRLPAYITSGEEVQAIDPFPICEGCGQVQAADELPEGRCHRCR